MELAKTAFLILEGPLDGNFDIIAGQRVDGEDLCPAPDGGVDADVGIFGSGADQDDPTAFQVGKQDVLLPLVQAMNFIEQEDHRATHLGLFCYDLQILLGVRGGV